MKLYFECRMGAAGDMLASALTDLFEDKAALLKELNQIGLPHTRIEYEEAEQCGIGGAHLHIIIRGEEETPDDYHHHHHHHHHGRTPAEIDALIDTLLISDKVKNNVKEVYRLVAEAESTAHRKPVGEIHFHELGTLDALADITLSTYLLDKLQPEAILCSPINVGSGTVHCAHGILPVPAPATANLLLGVPYYQSEIPTELCTPTGAAVLKYFVSEFTAQPAMESVRKIGIGCGTKQLEQANILRVFMFEDSPTVTELSCNIDDITGEEAAFATERMMAEGALDCFITPIFMKKGRPAYMFTVLCKNGDANRFASLIFRHTATLGIRRYTPSRYTLERELREEDGVRIKRSEGYGTVTEKIEFEDIRALALRDNISVFEARKRLQGSKD